MSQDEQNELPPTSSPQFSWGRVFSTVALVLLGVGTVIGIMLFPTPPKPKAVSTEITPEKIQRMRQRVERQVAEERAERERTERERESGDKP